MCMTGDQVPGSAADALRLMDAALDFFDGPGGDALDAAALGPVLAALGGLSASFAAIRAAILSRFDSAAAYGTDGYGSTAAWLAATGRTTRAAANAEVRKMRLMREHPEIRQALARKEVSESWATEIAQWTARFPAEIRGDVDRLLLQTAGAGASLNDLSVVAQAAFERWRQQQEPDPDGGPDDGFDERCLRLGTTIDNAGRLTGNLTPECTEAVQAVLEALGKKEGPEDDRTEPQRLHDALQLACTLLIRAGMVPSRAGGDTRIDAVISLAELLDLPGASELQEAWLAALAGQHGYLAGQDAEVAACDAAITPVVTGQVDLSVVDAMIDLAAAYLPGHKQPARPDDSASGAPGPLDGRPQPLSPQAWQALRYAMARLAIDLVSGPGGLASVLRRGLLDEPYTTKSVILDIGFSDSIPAHIRRAVQLRAQGRCEWPGCQRRAAHCDVHHLVHKKDGGKTSVGNCSLLCQFHHDVCVHRRGWRLVLHPDATTTACGPDGQELHSHGPPGSCGPLDR
jgi:hypothetical protein